VEQVREFLEAPELPTQVVVVAAVLATLERAAQEAQVSSLSPS
jgi:hypothetical protein